MDFDVIVVGAGNAAFAAAISAREHGARRVAVLEKASRPQRGGNTFFSGAILRFCFDKVADMDRFVPTAEEEYPGFHAGVPVYPREAFRDDLLRVTEGRTDPALSKILIDHSYDTACWMQDVGRMKFELARSVMGIKVGNQIKWPRGAIVRTIHEGVGLSDTWFDTAEKAGWKIAEIDHFLIHQANARILEVGGIISNLPDEPAPVTVSFITDLANAYRELHGHTRGLATGLGCDINGLHEQAAPRKDAASNPLTYPFKSYDGRVSFERQRSGERVFDLNVDGVAHYGLYPDFIADMQRTPGGEEALTYLFRSAEAYLQFWERSEAAARK